MNSDYVIAVDLGGTNLRAAKIDRDGHVLARAKIPTPSSASDPAVIAAAIVNSIRQCAGDEKVIEKAAVVVPGSVNLAGEKVIKAPHLPCLYGFELKKYLEKELGGAVILENDANAAAVGERWLGAAQGCQSIVCLTLGTGVGGGIILDGELWRGADGSAGEIGHTTVEASSNIKCDCGNTGCLELFASASGIIRMTNTELAQHPDSMLRDQELTGKSVYEAAIKGDELASSIFKTVGAYLGIAVSNLMNLLNPEVIVIGGGVANAWALFHSALDKEVQRRVFSNSGRIAPAACGDDAGVLGAARLAMPDTDLR